MTSITQPATPAQQLHGAVISIALAKISPPPFNPRKIFEGIDELGESIRAQGLLQPLVVRPGKKADTFELIGGERRLRALKAIKVDAAQCKVLNVDDGQAMAAQIVENLQREDVAPLEEAEGFKRLADQDPKTWTAQAIAKAVGKTDRFVQQRLAIARGLSPELKAKLSKGEISIEVARTIAVLPPALQAQVKGSWGVRNNDAQQVRAEVMRLVVPVTTAAFDAKDYTGTYLEDGDRKYFADVAQFDKLQAAMARALERELRNGLWKTAKWIDLGNVSDYAWADTLERVWSTEAKSKSVGKSRIGVDKLTAIVWIGGDRRLRQATGVVSAALAERARPAASRPSGGGGMPNRETAGQRRSRLDFNRRLVKACADKADTGARVLLTAFVGTHGARTTYDGNATQKMCETFLPPALAKIVQDGGGYSDKASAVWKIVKAMKLADVQRAIAGYGALAFIWDSQHGKKPKGLTAALSDLLKVKPREVDPPAKAKKPAADSKAVRK